MSSDRIGRVRAPDPAATSYPPESTPASADVTTAEAART